MTSLRSHVIFACDCIFFAKSHLPSSRRVWFTPQMAKSNLPLKLPSPIYPPPQNHQVWFTPPPNCQVQFTIQIAKSDLPLKLSSPTPPPKKKSPSPIYPYSWNCQVWFTPPITKSDLPPQITKSDPPPPNHNFWAHFSHFNIMLCFTKVFLFCERPMSVEGDDVVTNSARAGEMSMTNCCDL